MKIKIIFTLILTIFLSTTFAMKEKVKNMTYPVKHVSVSITQAPQKVYAYASNPENLPYWAAGLARTSLKKDGDFWVADSPMGKVKIKFAPTNDQGILDHDVTLPSGEVNHNAFRVIPNHLGSEVVFTIIHLPRMTEAEFKEDVGRVLKDLEKLKEIIEAKK